MNQSSPIVAPRFGTVLRSWLTFCAVTLAACGPVVPEPGSTLRSGETFEEFMTRTPREAGTGIYIVDGDTPVYSLDELREFYQRYVRHATNALAVQAINEKIIIWDATQRQNLTYCVSTAFGSRYTTVVNAMATATAEWEAAAGVNFIHNSIHDGSCNASNNNVLFDVSPTSGQSYLARAFFPNEPRSSRNILVNTTTAFSDPQVSITGLLRHELGHVLGFRHEHVVSGSCSESGEWSTATTYDSASVMHYPWCGGTNTGDLLLTQRDREGAALVYGTAPVVGIIPGVNGCPAGAPVVRINMDNEDSNQNSSVSNWVGATQRDGNGNLNFTFCRVNGSAFQSLSSASSSRSNYAVVKLSAECPPGSVGLMRYFDNEDSNNRNNFSGALYPNVMHVRGTHLRFCLFRGQGSVASGLPDLGVEYGVFAESNFGFTNATGSIYSDDEDDSNANGYAMDVPDTSAQADAQRIVSAGTNTTLRTARRAAVRCGDSICNGIETTSTCASDCERCGNGVCRLNENSYSCPQDCGHICGDGYCGPGESCLEDCGSTCRQATDTQRPICPL